MTAQAPPKSRDATALQRDLRLSRAESQSLDIARAEWDVLGGLLAYPDRVHEVAELLTIADWTSTARAAIFELIVGQAAKGKLPDQVETVWAIGQLPGTLVHREDVPTLLDAVEHVVSGADVLRRAEFIAQEAMRRHLIGALRAGIAALTEAEEPAAEGQALSMSLLELCQGERKHRDREAAELVDECLDQLEQRAQAPERTTGISTGIAQLDAMLRLERGRVYVVAARPAIGKSSLVAHFVRKDAGMHGWGVFSMEMSDREWADRLLCAEGGVDLRAYTAGRTTQPMWDALEEAASTLRRFRLVVDSRGGLRWAQVAAKVRQWAITGRVDAVVVDYLGLIRKRDPKMSTYDHVTEITQAAKGLARDLGIVVILVAQLNREVDKRPDKRPIMSDLRDSGSIEQDADVVLMLHREGYYDERADQRLAEVIVRKNRGGPTGTARTYWDGPSTRFYDGADEGGAL